MRIAGIEQDFKAIWESRVGDRHIGHAHFWDRALSRRQVLARAAGVAGAAVASPLVLPGLARGAKPGTGEPRPIPGGTDLSVLHPALPFVHFYFPTGGPPGALTIESGQGDPSTITDFNGFVGVGEWAGETGTDQAGTTLFWAADVRFMDGEYVGLDGSHRQGAFAFI
jgi:hypothetical protein